MKFGSKKAKPHAASLAHDRSAILREDSPFAAQEAYKTLRTNIMFSIPVGCLLYTSPSPRDS